MYTIIYYKDGEEQRVEGGVRTYLEVCARLETIAWRPGKEVIGASLHHADETIMTVTPLHFTWKPAIMREVVLSGGSRLS